MVAMSDASIVRMYLFNYPHAFMLSMCLLTL